MLDRLDDEKYLFLFYDDVVIKLVNGKALRTLRPASRFETKRGWGKLYTIKYYIVTIIMTENPKNKFRVVFLRCLQQEEDNPLWAIKWILISALWLGPLKEKSLGEVLAATAAQRDKTIQWAPGKGKLPVLCVFQGHWINTAKPRCVHQPKRLIRNEGLEDEIKAIFSHLSRLYRRILTTTTGRLTVAKRSRH